MKEYDIGVTRDPAGKVQLLFGIRWQVAHLVRPAHTEVRVPLRRALGHGLSGRPTYLVSVRLLRTLG